MTMNRLIAILLFSVLASANYAAIAQPTVVGKTKLIELKKEFLSKYKLDDDTKKNKDKWVLTHYSYKLNIPAKNDTTFMLKYMDKLVQEYVSLCQKQGINFKVKPGIIKTREEFHKGGYTYWIQYVQDFGYDSEGWLGEYFSLSFHYLS